MTRRRSGERPGADRGAAARDRGRGPELIVEAGAGTGKTGVMVDRYCRLVCDEGVSPDAVLAFTFTDKAAAELRQRIRAEIELRAERRLRAGPRAAPRPGQRLGDDDPRLLQPAALGPPGGDRDRPPLPGDRRARGRAGGAARPSTRRSRSSSRRAGEETGGHGRRLRRRRAAGDGDRRARGAAQPGRGRARPARAPGAGPAGRPAARGRGRRAGGGGAEARQLQPRAGRTGPGDARRPGAPAGARRAGLGAHRSKAKPMAEYREAIEAALAAVAEAGDGGRAYRHLGELLTLFSARFAAVKERRAGIDFEDLQILAARLLERTEVGSAYRSRFSHLLVDEFQDTNRLQLRLIEALRGPATQLMVVGDELQSIYGFRHADLDVFRERRSAIEASPGRRGDPADRQLPLAAGGDRRRQRARREPARRRLPAPAGRRPAAARRRPPARGRRSRCCSTTREGWDEDEIRLEPATDARTPANQLAEARFLAMRLRELADQGVERGAMVVLLRSFTRLDAHEDSLERAGLRPYVVGGRGYWSQQQVADVCALLATIANPLDDQSLLGALASPACGVAPDTLWLLRAAAGRGRHIWPTVEVAAGLGEDEGTDRERLAQIPEAELALLRGFAETLRDLRRRATSLSLARPDRRRGHRDRLRPGGADAPRRRGPLRQRAQADPARRRVRGRRGARPAGPARLPRRAGRRRRRRAGGDRGRGPRRGSDHDHPQRQGPRVRRRRDPPPLARPAALLRDAAAHPRPRAGASAGRDAAAPARRPRRQPLRPARALRGGAGARSGRGAAALPRRGDPGARAATSQRRDQPVAELAADPGAWP